MPIPIPRYATWRSLEPLLETVQAILVHEADPIVCEASETRFVDPLGLCLLAHAGTDAKSWQQSIEIRGLSPDLESYLARMDLLPHLGMEVTTPYSRRDRRDSLVEIRRVESHEEMEDCADRLGNAAAGSLPEQDAADPTMNASPREIASRHLQYILYETLANALSHARLDGRAHCKAFVAAQYYERKDLVRLAVVDDGCGFRATLSPRHPKLNDGSDADAILLALEPRVSCNPDVGIAGDTHNQGVGLTVCREIVTRAGGRMMVGSGHGVVHTNQRRTWFDSIGTRWQGAFVYAEFQREALLDTDIDAILNDLAQGAGPDIGLDFEP